MMCFRDTCGPSSSYPTTYVNYNTCFSSCTSLLQAAGNGESVWLLRRPDELRAATSVHLLLLVRRTQRVVLQPGPHPSLRQISIGSLVLKFSWSTQFSGTGGGKQRESTLRTQILLTDRQASRRWRRVQYWLMVTSMIIIVLNSGLTELFRYSTRNSRPICKKTFRSKDLLQLHRTVHEGQHHNRRISRRHAVNTHIHAFCWFSCWCLFSLASHVLFFEKLKKTLGSKCWPNLLNCFFKPLLLWRSIPMDLSKWSDWTSSQYTRTLFVFFQWCKENTS